MKTLILVRHAKSDWTQDVPDFNRPLNERGHHTAPRMARFLKEQGIAIDHFVSSPAKRALTTCRYFAETYNQSAIRKAEDLYEPHHEDFVHTLLNLSDTYQSAALFSHNPGISEFASSLVPESFEFPTCAVAVFEIDCEEWSQYEGAPKKLLHFYTPKEVLDQ